VAALQRQDINTDTGIVGVRQGVTEVGGVGLIIGSPRSRAGPRTVSVQSSILPAAGAEYAPANRPIMGQWFLTVKTALM
jgi:hypothetical protein